MHATKPRRATDHGMSRSSFYRQAHSGNYEKIARGLYLPANASAADWDWLEAASRHSRATICLTSALAHYDLIDDIPTALDIAIPRGTRAPATTGAIKWHHFAEDTFNLGRKRIRIPGSTMSIGIYSPERCIADAFRLRGNNGYELARDALREWLRRGGKPADLMDIAIKLPRAKGPTLQMLDAIA